jgi:hypothetical protein
METLVVSLVLETDQFISILLARDSQWYEWFLDIAMEVWSPWISINPHISL